MQSLTFSFWAVMVLFGGVQGLFLSVYLLAKAENKAANRWLAILLTAISLHLFEYGADISGLSLEYPLIIASTYPLLFCLGPAYYLYCRHLLDRKYKSNIRSVFHFLPSLLVFVMMLPFYTMPPGQKVSFILEMETNGELVIPAEQLVFMGAHVTQTIIYVFAAYRFIMRNERKLKEVTSDVLVIKKMEWMNSFSFYFCIYLTLYFILVVVLIFADSYQVQVDYLMLLITSFSIYAIGYTAIQNPEIFKALPDIDIPGVPKQQPEFQNGNRFPGVKARLEQLMEAQMPYLKSDLKILELADLLGVPSHQLSQVINVEFKVNFYDFVNSYRVEDAKRLLIQANGEHKMLAIAYDVGFNSKATFNRVFKKATGFTPSEYKERSLTGSHAANRVNVS